VPFFISHDELFTLESLFTISIFIYKKSVINPKGITAQNRKTNLTLMAWSKEDRSFKTLIGKRTTSSGKKYYEEFGDLTLDISATEIKTDAIPFNDPAFGVEKNVVMAHTSFTLTLDVTVGGEQSYYAADAQGNRLKDWISDKYGALYGVKLYQNDGAQIYPTDDSEWFFDYATGILTFNGSTAGLKKPFKISGYRYIGRKGEIGRIGTKSVYDGDFFGTGARGLDDAATAATAHDKFPVYNKDTDRFELKNIPTVRAQRKRVLADGTDAFKTITLDTEISNMLYVEVNGIIQDLGADYGLNGNVVTFYETPKLNDLLVIVYFDSTVNLDEGGSSLNNTYTTDQVFEGINNKYFTELRVVNTKLSTYQLPASEQPITVNTSVTGAIGMLEYRLDNSIADNTIALRRAQSIKYVETLADRDAIPQGERTEGMQVVVKNDANPDNNGRWIASADLLTWTTAFSFGVNNSVTGINSFALGTFNTATGENSVVMGGGSTAEGLDSQAFGYMNKAIGDYSHATGRFTEATGVSSHAEGNGSIASGVDAHAEGGATKASGNASHAEGGATEASGSTAHAEGQGTVASGDRSHAEGHYTSASGIASHAEGYSTYATGDNSHAEGYSTEAIGTNSHAEGYSTEATAQNAHAEGYYTNATGVNSHAEGYYTTASGYASHAEGESTTASGENAHAEGEYSVASGENSHAEGYDTEASGRNSHAEGKYTVASADGAHAEGKYTVASADGAHAEGYSSAASGEYAHAEGYDTEASGSYAHAEGEYTTASGDNSHAEGESTTASGENAHAEGYETVASGENAHAEGSTSVASGDTSHAEGDSSVASGNYSHAEGYKTLASGTASHASGIRTKAAGSSTYAGGLGGYGNASNNYEPIYVIASGTASFNHSEAYISTNIGAAASNSAILGGVNNQIQTTAPRSVILGGSNINATEADTVYVKNLRVLGEMTNTSGGKILSDYLPLKPQGSLVVDSSTHALEFKGIGDLNTGNPFNIRTGIVGKSTNPDVKLYGWDSGNRWLTEATSGTGTYYTGNGNPYSYIENTPFGTSIVTGSKHIAWDSNKYDAYVKTYADNATSEYRVGTLSGVELYGWTLDSNYWGMSLGKVGAGNMEYSSNTSGRFKFFASGITLDANSKFFFDTKEVVFSGPKTNGQLLTYVSATNKFEFIAPAAQSWSMITSKPTTISGYAITDAYTKDETDAKLGGLNGAVLHLNTTGDTSIELRKNNELYLEVTDTYRNFGLGDFQNGSSDYATTFISKNQHYSDIYKLAPNGDQYYATRSSYAGDGHSTSHISSNFYPQGNWSGSHGAKIQTYTFETYSEAHITLRQENTTQSYAFKPDGLYLDDTKILSTAKAIGWDDKYTKAEVDNKFIAQGTNLIWKGTVATFSDLATTYPNPVDNWTVVVENASDDPEITTNSEVGSVDYRYDATAAKWINIGNSSVPMATATVDGKMSKEYYVAVRDLSINQANKIHYHSGTDITSGTLADARLSNNVPLRNISNTFTSEQTVALGTGLSAFSAKVTGETGTRFTATSSGRLEWGDGTNNRDTSLYRQSAAILRTDGDFQATAIRTGTLFNVSTLSSLLNLTDTGTEIKTSIASNVALKTINTDASATGDIHQYIKGSTMLGRFDSAGTMHTLGLSVTGGGTFSDRISGVYSDNNSYPLLQRMTLNLHPESGGPTYIPYATNDLAFIGMGRKGGSVTSNVPSVATVLPRMFNGAGDYFILNPSTLPAEGFVLEITLHKTFMYSTAWGVTFGAHGWGAKNITLELYKPDTLTWVTVKVVTAFSGNTFIVDGVNNGAAGYTKARFTFKDFASPASSSGFRISQVFAYNYDSPLFREVWVGRDGGDIYGSLAIDGTVTTYSAATIGGNLSIKNASGSKATMRVDSVHAVSLLKNDDVSLATLALDVADTNSVRNTNSLYLDIDALGTNSNAFLAIRRGVSGASPKTYAQVYAGTGNLVLQNGGTYADAGYRLDVIGTARVKGTLFAKGIGNTNTTKSLRVENSDTTQYLEVTDDGLLKTTGAVDASGFKRNGSDVFVNIENINPAQLINIGDVPGTEVAKITNPYNWDKYGNYVGEPIINTYMGQKIRDTNYLYMADEDDVWIRLMRG
jgi:hypothetical protein